MAVVAAVGTVVIDPRRIAVAADAAPFPGIADTLSWNTRGKFERPDHANDHH